MKNVIIITGSLGLVGAEAVKFFCKKKYSVIGIDNDMRKYFFGSSVRKNLKHFNETFKNYSHNLIDIRNKKKLSNIFNYYQNNIKLIIHCAAQPSHDWAAKEPHTDFEINANGTLNLLDLTLNYCPKAKFIFMSTNKVYGDKINTYKFRETKTRYTPKDYKNLTKFGVSEKMTIDQSKHSIFGVSKTAADLMVQEYGKYFDLNTVIFRGGCLTGPLHQGAELHGFLSYLVKCNVMKKNYFVKGYKGKQVRDNIHSTDLINAFWHYFKSSKKKGEVYNIGGGIYSNCSLLEASEIISYYTKKTTQLKFEKKNRSGDHIWWISDLRKFKSDFPDWKINFTIHKIIEDIYINNK
tara:strand:- start:26971 stop:28023 length:1053 start_codon:yes stop_codon:yes gene_type:complete